MFAIVLVPLLLAGAFGGLRLHSGWTAADDLRLAADRAEMVPYVEKYMVALDGAMLANSTGGDAQAALTTFDTSKQNLQRQLTRTDVVPDVRAGVTGLLDGGQALLDQVTANGIDLRGRLTAYAPILLTAEDVVTGSVRVDDEEIRAEALGLSRAIGARGQMLMQQLLVNLGGDLPEPELRTSMITLAGTEPSTLFGMAQVLGVGSPDAQKLQEEMVKRMGMMSDPAVALVGNPELTQSLEATNEIAEQDHRLRDDVGDGRRRGPGQCPASTRPFATRLIVAGAMLVALIIVLLVARTLVRPLRMLRDGALKVAHEDLARELEQVRNGGAPGPVQPLPVNTTEEVGQVAHAVDELHEQAVVAGRRAGPAAVAARRHVRDVVAAQPVARRSAAGPHRPARAQRGRPRAAAEPVPARSPRRPHAPQRREPVGARRARRCRANRPIRFRSAPWSTRPPPRSRTTPGSSRRPCPTARCIGVVAGDLVHLLAELLDNALRYSPPSAQVRVSAVHTGNGGLVIEVSDDGLGMTDADLRVANTRLQSGGEVNPYTARHMGLFVVGRLAAQHGLVVRLRNTVAGEPNSGTTAGVFVPAELLLHGPGGPEVDAPRYDVPTDFAATTDPRTSTPSPAHDVDQVRRLRVRRRSR